MRLAWLLEYEAGGTGNGAGEVSGEDDAESRVLCEDIRTLGPWCPFEELPQDPSRCPLEVRAEEKSRLESWIQDAKFLESPTSHFPDGQTEFPRGRVTGPMSQSW